MVPPAVLCNSYMLYGMEFIIYCANETDPITSKRSKYYRNIPQKIKKVYQIHKNSKSFKKIRHYVKDRYAKDFNINIGINKKEDIIIVYGENAKQFLHMFFDRKFIFHAFSATKIAQIIMLSPRNGEYFVEGVKFKAENELEALKSYLDLTYKNNDLIVKEFYADIFFERGILF